MEKSVQTLNYLFLGQHLRIVLDEKESPWFIANDVCGILGYENSSKTISELRIHRRISAENGLRLGDLISIVPVRYRGIAQS